MKCRILINVDLKYFSIKLIPAL